MHDERIAVHLGQVGHVAAAGPADARQIVARQIDQHQVLSQLFVVGAHFQFDAAVEIQIQRTIGTAAARASAGDRVDFDLAIARVVFQRTLRRSAEQGEVIILHEEHVRAGVVVFQGLVGCQRRRARQGEAARRHHWKISP